MCDCKNEMNMKNAYLLKVSGKLRFIAFFGRFKVFFFLGNIINQLLMSEDQTKASAFVFRI